MADRSVSYPMPSEALDVLRGLPTEGTVIVGIRQHNAEPYLAEGRVESIAAAEDTFRFVTVEGFEWDFPVALLDSVAVEVRVP